MQSVQLQDVNSSPKVMAGRLCEFIEMSWVSIVMKTSDTKDHAELRRHRRPTRERNS
jgi:hypothetical protein